MTLLAAFDGEELRSCKWDDLIADGRSHHFIKLACFSPMGRVFWPLPQRSLIARHQ
jgi:hypothetical protein